MLYIEKANKKNYGPLFEAFTVQINYECQAVNMVLLQLISFMDKKMWCMKYTILF